MEHDQAISNFDFFASTGASPKIKDVPADPACRRIILTGAVQSGKSTLAEKLINQLKEKNITMAGILARGLWKNNQRNGFDLVNIRTGKVTPLARRSAELATQNSDKIPFSFFEQGVTAGYDALNVARCKSAAIIMVDEVGKLEAKGLGWASCLSPLLALSQSLHIWIVRENLVRQICRIWPVGLTTVIHADAPNALLNLTTACVKEP
jgi:iron complex transport system ATP-binding protein